jgi:histidine phosphotransferase ChpT
MMAVGGGATGVDGAVGLRLANLLAARLCHDLSAPLTGLGAALGEAAEDPAALALARDAVLALGRRLSLFRTAWGCGTAALPRAMLRELAGGLPNAAQLRVELEALAEHPPFPPPAARVVASTLLLAAESLPGGGLLALAGNPRGAVVVTIAGPRAAWPAGLGAMLASPEAAWEAASGLAGPAGLRRLPAPLLALLAHAAGVRAGLLLAGQPEQAPPLLLDFAAVTAA